MKRKLGIITLALAMIVSLAAAIGMGSKALNAEGKDVSENKSSEKRVVKVRGTAQISAAPDIAYINLGARTLDKDVKKAQEENNKKTNAIIAAAKKLGIQDADIQTNGFNIYERYEYNNDGERKSLGYEVSTTLRLTVRDISKAGEVFDGGVKAGANIADGISFDIKDKDVLYNKALKSAMRSAEIKATSIMSTFGKTPSAPYRVEEVSSQSNSYNQVYLAADSLKKESSSEMNVKAGELTISASVAVEYIY